MRAGIGSSTKLAASVHSSLTLSLSPVSSSQSSAQVCSCSDFFSNASSVNSCWWMVSIEPCEIFSSSSARVRTRLSDESAVEIRRKSRASWRIDTISSSRRRRRSRRWRATSACRNTTLSEAKIAMNPAWPTKVEERSAPALELKQITASKPMAAAASGRPTARRWNVTRKLTTA